MNLAFRVLRANRRKRPHSCAGAEVQELLELRLHHITIGFWSRRAVKVDAFLAASERRVKWAVPLTKRRRFASVLCFELTRVCTNKISIARTQKL